MKHLRIASRPCEAERIHKAVLPELARHGYTAEAQFAVRLALDEALANAISHGNHQDPAKQVTVDCTIDDEEAVLSVEDEGRGFDPRQVPDPTLDENLEKPHGRGIMLMRAYMSRVSFNKAGNCVTMVKQRSCRRPQEMA